MTTRTVPGAAPRKTVPGAAKTTAKAAAAKTSANANKSTTATFASFTPTSQLRAAQNSLPRAQYLTFEEELTHDVSADAKPNEISPIEVEVCGVGATQYDESFLWWLLATFHLDLREKRPLIVGMALSLQINGQVDAILLSTRRRLLIIRTRHLTENRSYNRVGKTQFDEHIIDKNDHLGALLYNRLYVERQRVHLVGFHGALQALHIHRATGLHSRIVDISTDKDGRSYKPAHIRILKAKTFKDKADEIAALRRTDFKVQVDRNSGFDFDGYMTMAIESVSACSFAKQYSDLVASDERPLVDTARLSLRDLDVGARVVAVFHSINMLQPEMRKADFTDVLPGDERDSLFVENERFSTRLMPNSMQTLQLRLQDGSVVEAVTTRAHGKTSEIRVRAKGDSESATVPVAMPAREDITEIVISGREDADMAQNHAVRFWFHVMRWRDIDNEKDMKDMQGALDPSGLFYPLFYGEAPVVTTIGVRKEIRKFGPPSEEQRYSVIETSKLDPSQREAAFALAAPIRTHGDRLKLIHGPPGTGKTTVIAQFCKQWCSWVHDRLSQEGGRVAEHLQELLKPPKLCVDDDKDDDDDGEGDHGEHIQIRHLDAIQPEDIIPSTWCVCQSNAAVKNIAEGLKKAGVKFKILVSDNFFVEWHEHIYTALSAELIITSSLNTTVHAVKQEMSGVCVFLSTISGLSSQRLEDAKLFILRPIYTLLVDEASQIPLGAYPHLLSRHSQTMARMAFFGDHKQLAPFGSDTIESIESVFELRHLIERAQMLKVCYRLPRPLCAFVSREVYDGLLTSADTAKHREPLTRSVRFIDVDSGEESRGESSFENVAEARSIATFIQKHLMEVDFRVLAPYTRQRDVVERELKLQNLPWEGRVFTVDSFQGQEADVIIVSLVRDGKPLDGHTAGFLTNERRSNVLITRCKIAMYVFSSKRFLLGPDAKARTTLIGALANLVATADPQDVADGDDDDDDDVAMKDVGKAFSRASLDLIDDDADDDDDEDSGSDGNDEDDPRRTPRVYHAGWRNEIDVALGRAALPPPPGGFEPPAQYNAPIADLSALALSVTGEVDGKKDGVDSSTLRIAAMLADQGGRNKGKGKGKAKGRR